MTVLDLPTWASGATLYASQLLKLNQAIIQVRDVGDAAASGLAGEVTTRAAAVTALQTALGAETTARTTAITTTQTSVTTEVSNRTVADIALNADLTARLAAVNRTATEALTKANTLQATTAQPINFLNFPVYANEAAAITGGLVTGNAYRKSDGSIWVVVTDTNAPFVPGSSTPTTLAGWQIARNLLAPISVGDNIERSNAWQGLTYNGSVLKTNTAFYQNRQTLGQNAMRMFMPWRPVYPGGFSLGLPSNYAGSTTPTAAMIDVLLDCCATAIAAGHVVFVQWTDVISKSELDQYWTAIAAYLDLVAQRIALRNFPLYSFATGPFNELEGGDNGDYNTYRQTAHNIFRARLPTTVLTTGAAEWMGFDALMRSDWVAISDTGPWLCDTHIYYGGYASISAWNSFQADVDDFSARNGNVPVMIGELGPDDFGTGHMQYSQRWVDNLTAWSLSNFRKTKGIIWATTNGGDFRTNTSASNAALRSEMASLMPTLNTNVRAASGFGSLYTPSGGSGTAHVIVLPVPTAVLGAHVYTFALTGIANGTTMSLTAVNGAPSYNFSGTTLTATVASNSVTFPSLTLTSGQFYKIWEGAGVDPANPTFGNQEDSPNTV